MYSKKKDKSPIETVNNIRKILHDVGIFVTEAWNKSKDSGFATIFSVRLSLFGMGKFGVNGKGTTPEYTLASAYAELMERLQAGILLRNLTKCTIADFIVAPDKVLFSKEEFLRLNNSFSYESFLKMTKSAFINQEINQLSSMEELVDFWLETVDCCTDKQIIGLPYYSIKEKKSLMLPQSMIVVGQRSNGMCAGNTPEEALVQGLSEVFERVAAVEIIKNGLTPPTIPESEYKDYKGITKLINYYEKLGYNVVIKDCSLGKNYPTISVAIIDRETQKYLLSFGANPSLPIAIERCLTEASQGRDFEEKEENQKAFLSLSLNKDSNIIASITNQFKNGVGEVTPKYFSEESDWEYDKSTWKNESYSNKELLYHLIDICLKNSEDVYIRDFSYLGFPTYQIFIPEMSPCPENYKTYNYLNGKHSESYILERYETKEGLEEIYNAAIEAVSILNPDKNDFLISNIPDILIAIDCCIKLEKDDEALKHINEISSTYSRYESNLDINEINCLKTILELKQNAYTQKDILNILFKFYEETTINKIVNLWFSKNTLEQLINTKPETDKMEYIKKKNIDIENVYLAMDKVSEVKNRLKEIYESNTPNQDDLINVFNSYSQLASK